MVEIVCPSCKNPTYDEDALLCHFCGGSLRRNSTGGVLGKMRGAGARWIWISVGVVLAVMTIITMFLQKGF
ncbi:MAG: hypothetical protein HQL17_00670 [Candidatus Omnitrophica bacterium]|nr:hypothetical protein [Candidatus Omnitrophota bacterium]